MAEDMVLRQMEREVGRQQKKRPLLSERALYLVGVYPASD
jgi:hypothetical protein